MRDRRVLKPAVIWSLGVGALVMAACGPDPTATSEPGGETISLPAPDEPADELATPAQAPDGGRSADLVAAPPLALQTLEQPAIWPAADVVFTTPEEAATDFVSSLLIGEGDPLLGEFQAGDARSGEITVLFAGETGDLDPPQEKGVLLLRQIGPTDGWYVIAATSDGVVIDTPSASDEVPAGVLTVAGEGRGFEGTLVVTAFPPGDDAAELDLQIGAGGAMADLEPFSVELDISGATPGEVVTVLVQGDTGLGNDPSTFAAIPIVIASTTPDTIPATE